MDSKAKLTVLLAGTFLTCGAVLAAEHKVGEKGVTEVFEDATIARLARMGCDGDAAGIAALVRSGANPNSTGFKGSTPLLWALSCENIAGMRALLEAGADPNEPTVGFSAVYAASTYANSALLSLLLEFGGDPNASDSKSGVTALMKAEDLGNNCKGWSNYDLLLASGSIDVNRAIPRGGQTIAVVLAKDGQWDRVLDLLHRGYSHDLKDFGYLVWVLSSEEYSPRQTPFLAEVRQELVRRGIEMQPLLTPRRKHRYECDETRVSTLPHPPASRLPATA
jgi:hypothetical protein